MSQGFAPFYDVNRTYEDNYLQGPFGAFAEVMKGDSAAGASAQSAQTTQSQSSDQAEEFLGFRVNLPFGIPAGPLLNERFTTAAFRMGFDLAVYKTVRSRAWGCNAFPNVLAVHPKNADGSLVPGSAELDEGVLADTRYELPISISNSFGVPSRDPDEWQPDMKKAIAAAGDGQGGNQFAVAQRDGNHHDQCCDVTETGRNGAATAAHPVVDGDGPADSDDRAET